MTFTKEHSDQNKALQVAIHNHLKGWRYHQLKDHRLITQAVGEMKKRFPDIAAPRIRKKVQRAADYLAKSKAPGGKG